MSESTDKLVAALREANAPAKLVIAAERHEYHDFKSPHDMPIHKLVEDLGPFTVTNPTLKAIIHRAKRGDFDATKAESDEWAASPDGQDTFRQLLRRQP